MEKVKLDATKFDQIENTFIENTAEVDVPEFNPLMGLPSLSDIQDVKNKLTKLLSKKTKSKSDQKEIEKFKKRISDFKTTIVTVKQIELSDYISIKNEINDQMQNLIDGVASAATLSEDAVKDEVKIALKKMEPQARYRILLVQKGLLDPKLTWAQLIYVSKLFPAVILRLSDKILQLTEKGATLKKSIPIS